MNTNLDWSRLDNAAKIFPPATSKRDTKVFRFSCQLKEFIDPICLSQAVKESLEAFPFFRCVLKQGLFWYYFEESKLIPQIEEENLPPCSPIYNINKKTLLFRVTYFQKRINLEIHHALTDGTGALQFLRALVYHYLLLRHPDTFEKNIPEMDYDASFSQKSEDSFQKYYADEKKEKSSRKVAYQIRHSLLPEGRLRVIEGICSVKELLKTAHDNHTTMTVYLTAVLFRAIYEDMPVRCRKRPVIICVPVNLRNFFDSETARNFFSVINISYDFNRQPADLSSIIEHVKESFDSQLTKEKISAHINKLISIEKNPLIRITPLFLKKIVLRIAHNQNYKEATSTISNIGKISMPSEMEQYIDRFEVFISTARVQICICSFGDKLTISFTSPFNNTEIQKHFFRTLTKSNIPVEIVSNLVNEEIDEKPKSALLKSNKTKKE